jgi:dTDP-4-amino-4,6-dideoxygalactose transaminase
MAEELAILGGKRAVEGRVAPDWPQFDQTEREAVLEALESRKWNQGKKVEAFEEAFAAYQNASYGVACTGGTVALEIACRAAGVGVGDEVITSPYTFSGTVVAILKAGATVTFADIDPDTNNIDPDEIEKAITPRTKAVMVVHYGGLACDMKRIDAIARKHRLAVLEDAAHGWGASYEDRGLGSLGLASGFSFQQSKNMTSGEGGIALTNDEGIADAMQCAVNAGRSKYDKAPEHARWGGNHRMTELSAAILLCQLRRVEAQTEVREQNAAQLTRTLSQVEGIRPVERLPEATRVSWHAYGARFISEAFEGVSRTAFVKAMQAEGVPISTGYTVPVYKYAVLQQDWDALPYSPFAWTKSGDAPDYRNMHLPKAEQYCKERLTLSQTLLLGEEDKIRDVCRAFQKVREQAKALRDWEARN